MSCFKHVCLVIINIRNDNKLSRWMTYHNFLLNQSSHSTFPHTIPPFVNTSYYLFYIPVQINIYYTRDTIDETFSGTSNTTRKIKNANSTRTIAEWYTMVSWHSLVNHLIITCKLSCKVCRIRDSRNTRRSCMLDEVISNVISTIVFEVCVSRWMNSLGCVVSIHL